MIKEIMPTEVVRLLVALKGIYTFKELEAYLKIPSQVLWRYTKYLNIPEKNTARKILFEIEKNKLIRKSLGKAVEFSRYGYIETWKINRNIHLLNLFGYLIYSHIKAENERINSIISLSTDAIPLATISANWLESPLYILYSKPYLTMDRWKSKEYLKKGDDKMSRVYLPREVFKRDDKILMLDLVMNNASLINSLSEFIEDNDAVSWGVIVALSKDDSWINEVRESLRKNTLILMKIAPEEKGSYSMK